MPGAAVAGRHVRTFPCSGTCYHLRVWGLSLRLSGFAVLRPLRRHPGLDPGSIAIYPFAHELLGLHPH